MIGSLFGTKTSIIGQGIYGGAQSVGSIMSGGFDASYYSDVKKTKKFLGISTSSSYSTQYTAADAELERQFSLIFEGFYNADATVARAPKVDRENYYGSVNDREKIEADMITAKVEHDFGQGTTLRNVTRVGKNHLDRTLTGINAITATNANPASWTVSRSRQRVDQENTILANQTSINTGFSAGGLQHTLAAGVELMHEKQVTFGRGTAVAADTPAAMVQRNPG